MKVYLSAIAATAATGNATKHNYRAHVEALFHRLYPVLEITNEPRRQKCGAPDFVVERAGVPVGVALNELFPRTLLGPNSHRDDFAIAFNEQEANDRIRDFEDISLTNELMSEKYSLKDNRDWNLAKARAAASSEKIPIKCLYRPFRQQIYAVRKLCF